LKNGRKTDRFEKWQMVLQFELLFHVIHIANETSIFRLEEVEGVREGVRDQ
jgi:hypothetical protein